VRFERLLPLSFQRFVLHAIVHARYGLPAAVSRLQSENDLQGPMTSRIISPLAIGLLLFVHTARADDPPPPSPAPAPPAKNDAPDVMVIGDKADSLQKTPGSGTLIGHKEIDRAQPSDAAEMLRRVPGVNVYEQEGGGLRLDLGVHGLDPGRARNVLILEDGIPIAVNPYSEADIYYLPQIERMRGIEVVKGSGSILFGPQTIGGVVNFLTLAPPSSELTAVEVDYGQRNYAKVLALHGDSLGSARYIVQAFHTRTARQKTSVRARPQAGRRRGRVSPKHEPCGCRGWYHASPPFASARPRTIDKPRPVPSRVRAVRSARAKRSNKRGTNSAGTPSP
jgi:outer membrane receptor protein involved in Fe transport